MITKIFIRHTLYFIFLICSLGVVSSCFADEDYEVIIHPRIADKTISINALRAIFGMRMQTWSDGARIRVFVLSDDMPLHQRFSKRRLNVFPYQLRSAWDRLVFSGIGQAPVKVATTEEMLVKVANTPGAIGYLWRSDLDDSVEVLQIK